MSVGNEIEDLRLHLQELASKADVDLTKRYALRPLPGDHPGLYRQIRRRFGGILRRLGLRATPPSEPWLPGLKHVCHIDEPSALLIWALGTDRETLRTACRGFQAMQGSLKNRVPVLVTDVADFSFFSRLGWLVEYVPSLSTAGGYAARKERYLAWLYRDVPAVPVTVGLYETVRAEDLLLD